MSEKTFNNSIVKKPWGHEYLAYRNQHLAIWFLKIEGFQETSFHCHCKKNTGLIVLDGIARISFINNGINLKGLDKVQIFKGRFHSTKALSKNGACILEIESPEDKTDLVRLKDKYDREGKPYEGPSALFAKNEFCLQLEDGSDITHSNCRLKIQQIYHKQELIGREFEEVIVILNGGIISKDGQQVSFPGDAISAHNLDILLEKLDIMPYTEVLSIKRV